MSNRDLNLIADLAEDYIEMKARERGGVSEIWELYAEQMGDRRYSNEAFSALTKIILRESRALEDEFAQRDDRFEDWIKDAVEAVVNGNFSTSVLSDKKLANALDDRVYKSMVRDADWYEDLIRGGRGGRRGGRDRDRDERDESWSGGRTRSSGRDRDEREKRGGNRYEGSDRTSERRSAGDRDRKPDRGGSSSTGSGNSSWAALASAARENQGRPSNARVADDDVDDDDYQEEPVVRHERQPIPITDTAPAITPEVVGPDHRQIRPYDDFYDEEGRHCQPRHLSDWKVTTRASTILDQMLDQMPHYTNHNKHIAFLVKSHDGTVTEEFIVTKPENAYLQEDLQVDPVRAREGNKPRTAALDLRSVSRESDTFVVDEHEPLPTANRLSDLERLLAEIDPTAVDVTTAPIVDNLSAAVFVGHSRLKADPERKPRIDMHVVRDAVAIENDNQHELVDEVFQANNLADAAAKMRELKQKFEPGLWSILNTRFSAAVMRAKRFQYQFTPVSSMSFATDWPLLVNLFAARRNQAEAALFSKNMRVISQLACNNVGPKSGDYIADTADTPNQKAVVFTDWTAMITLDQTLDSLGIDKDILKPDSTGVAISLQGAEGLYKLLLNVYTELDKKIRSPGKVRVYLVTADYYRIEVLPYAQQTSAFILALA